MLKTHQSQKQLYKNDTDYLLSNPIMKKRLLKAIKDFKKGKVVKRNLIEVD